MEKKTDSLQDAVIGGGCFWCTEAVFQRVRGVEKVVSGYSGGSAPGRPTYREVCSGRTGHAEAVRITFDPSEISYKELLTLFMATHDPTALNRQGADVGTQYRSVIFYLNEAQKTTAETVLGEMAEYYTNPIVTEVSPLKNWYEAEAYHQNYYEDHASEGYCRVVIDPKLQKLRNHFASYLKD